MLLSINQDLRTTTIIVWKEKAYPILENVMLQKEISLNVSPYFILKFLLRLFFLSLLQIMENLIHSTGTQQEC